MLKVWFYALLIIIGLFIGAFAHEHDILVQCLKTGNSGQTSWTTSFDYQVKGVK